MDDRSEIRALGEIGEIRAGGDENARTITGYAAVFDAPTEIGGMFREQIRPGAFADAIKGDDVRALVDHNSSLVLGRTRAGTLRLSEDDRGLRVEIDLPETQLARDLAVSIERGDVNQMSFGFSMRGGKEAWDDSGEVPLRTIERVGSLFDVSVVTYPAYPETEAAVRSLGEYRFNRSRKERLAVRDMLLRKRAALAALEISR
ncbi:MAG: HK97 family phage prohead protease [Alphaproteobacteria bacterium]|nr:MAG: HK97 family phage prohead protease [Alphaproteobacteria bacterium]